MRSVYRNLFRLSILTAFVICALNFGTSREAYAVSGGAAMYIDAEGDGKITGYVGSAITPYRFTLTVKKGPAGSESPSFKYAYEAGRNVTDWFCGICDPERNIFKRLPVGLTVKTVNAISVGDTSAVFEISGTPYMGSSGWLQIGISKSVFDGNPQHTEKVETGNGIQLSIIRSNSNISLKLSPTSLKITGSAGSAIASKELTVNLTGGNFIVEYPANKDVSNWFRGSDWMMNYEGEYMTAKLPEGMSVKLKKAVKIGDTSCTFVISGTPAYGAKEYLVPAIPQGSIAFAGSDRNEHGYGPQGFGCNNDYTFNISGTSNKPGIELESLKVDGTESASITGAVGSALSDNLLTYRLTNCTLRTSYAPGHDITGLFVKWSYPAETYLFDGMGVKVEVVDFTAGNNYFTCRIIGTPKKSGHGYLTVKLMEDDTSAGVRMSSISNTGKTFGFSTPGNDTAAYISTMTLHAKLGFMLDTSDTPVEIEMSQGYSTEYCLYGTFTKDQDVSGLVSGLPSGVKAYSAETVTNPAVLRVYFKGVPASAATYKAYADISGKEYASRTGGSGWSSSSSAGTHNSSFTDTYVTINVTAAGEAGIAYSYSLDPNDAGTGAVSGLPYDEFKSLAASEPIYLRGGISTKQFVIVESGNAAIRSKSVYAGKAMNVWLYIPQITFSKAYNELATVNDIVRLMRVNESGSVTNGPLTGYKIVTETALPQGKRTGVNILLYIESTAADADTCFDGLQLQIYDGSSWKNITMPVGSQYEIGEVITGNTSVTLSNYNGLSASIGDCVINGFSWQSLMDRLGVEVTVSGATFRLLHRGADVTSWFTNLPAGMSAAVKEDAPAGSNTVKIRFGKTNPRTSKISAITPAETSKNGILITVPFSALAESKFDNIDGGIVAAENENAKYNILESSEFGYLQSAMITSVEFAGEYRRNGTMGDGITTEYATVYVPGSLLNGYTKPMLSLTLTSQNDDIVNYNQENLIVVESSVMKKTNEANNIYSGTVNLYLPGVSANRIANGQFDIAEAYICEYSDGSEQPSEESFKEINLLPAYIKYNIVKEGTPIDDGDTVEHFENDEDGDVLPTGKAPDIWVNGKDNKKEEIYRKTLTKDVSNIVSSFPDDCKIVVSVTDTTVEEASGAFSSGKAKKSNTAKASYKKADNTVVVTAGKTEGTARIWIGAIDKQKAVKACEYFDVSVGTAPKKIYVTGEKDAAATETVKSVALSAGGDVELFVNANGTELSPHAKFTWTAVKDNDCLEIIPSDTTHSAVIMVKSAPTDGKVLKASVAVVNVESGRKAKVSIMLQNAVISITGIDETLVLDSAAEAAVEQKLAYTPVCADGGSNTTDKIKVYTTSATEEGSGFTNNGKKFTLSSKSKIKVTYKNGEFTLKAPKKTTDGTKVRVLVVVTHADKSIEVFESGVISIGKASE
ncbi:MAG: hypothetical protein J5824_04785 [Lachnospiraceae bacterium]|nr:hypothetical protein [Lachnospiraceae bacterium]